MIPVPNTDHIDGTSLMAMDLKGVELTPKWDSIPAEFKKDGCLERKLFHDVFFGYVSLNDVLMRPRDGVNARDARRALNLVRATFGTSHEHKGAGWAMLCREWFCEIKWERTKSKSWMEEG